MEAREVLIVARVSAASEIRRSEGEERGGLEEGGRRFRRGMRGRSSLMLGVIGNTIVDRVHGSTIVRNR